MQKDLKYLRIILGMFKIIFIPFLDNNFEKFELLEPLLCPIT